MPRVNTRAPRAQQQTPGPVPPREQESGTWRRELSPTQEKMAELAADLLLNGGANEDITALVYILLRHEMRRKCPWGSAADVDTYAKKHQVETRNQLARHWPEPTAVDADATQSPTSKAKRQMPTLVKEMVRANVRRELHDAFIHFLGHSDGAADLYLLRDVLIDYRSGEGELGEAFALQLEADHTYVQCAWKHHEKVRQFVGMLEEA